MFTPNQYFSYNLNSLPKGCQYCVRGEKLVLFVTGLCPRKCYFCPLSDKKYGQDIIYANERIISAGENAEAEILEEAHSMRAKGAGITGGDPLMKLDRTVSYIKLLKEKFGVRFHIHLYTSLDLVTEESLKKLFEAGLDEIRFHPDLDNQKFWTRIDLAKKFSWDIGVEIPLVPNKEKEIQQLIDLIKDKVKFLNMNELETADNEHSKLSELGFCTIDNMSYAIKDSLTMGLNLLEYAQKANPELEVNLCTAKLKDAVQLANRLKRQAKFAKKDFDVVDEEGLFTRGALYLDELKPGMNYHKELEKAEKSRILYRLKPLFEEVKSKLRLHEREIYLDNKKLRILISRKMLEKNTKELKEIGLVPAIVKEYPTADQLEIEVRFV